MYWRSRKAVGGPTTWWSGRAATGSHTFRDQPPHTVTCAVTSGSVPRIAPQVPRKAQSPIFRRQPSPGSRKRQRREQDRAAPHRERRRILVHCVLRLHSSAAQTTTPSRNHERSAWGLQISMLSNGHQPEDRPGNSPTRTRPTPSERPTPGRRIRRRRAGASSPCTGPVP